MTPSEAKNFLRELERAADEHDATDSWRAREFRRVIGKAFAAGWDEGYTSGSEDEYQAARAVEKRAKAAAEETGP